MMGKGDQKSRRGKLFKGTYGVRRKRKKITAPAHRDKTIPKKKESKPEGTASKETKKPAASKKTTNSKTTTAEKETGDQDTG